MYVPLVVHDVLRSPGQPLDAETRAYMEPRFGHDFSRVRVHADAKAAESAQAVNAQAYTVGRDIVFGTDAYSPSTYAGRQLVAHEMAHVVQQSAEKSSSATVTSSPILQRQEPSPWTQPNVGPPWTSPPPPDFDCSIDPGMLARLIGGDKYAAWKVLNCCVSNIPVAGRGCTSTLVDIACKLAPELCEKKKKEGDKTKCPPGFRPSHAFKGKCCPESSAIDTDNECCFPSKAASTDKRCCGADEYVQSGSCVKFGPIEFPPCDPFKEVSYLLPPCICRPFERQNRQKFTCCPVGQEGSSGTCVPAGKKTTPPIPGGPPPKEVEPLEIYFVKDAPQSWYDPRASFQVSVTSEGKTSFEALVNELNSHPKEKVQLEARASSEKPADDANYNQKLTDRRVRLIATELQNRKIDVATRVADPPGKGPTADCVEIGSGQLSCGDKGAANPPAEKDRKVSARVFSVTK